MRRITRAISGAAAVALLCGTALGQAATATDFEKTLSEHQAKMAELMEAGRPSRAQIAEANKELLAKLDVSKLSLDQIAELRSNRALMGAEGNEALQARLKELGDKGGMEGARALAIHYSLLPWNEAEKREEIGARLVNHDHAMDLMNTDEAGGVMRAMAGYAEADEGANANKVHKMVQGLPMDLPPDAAPGLRGVVQSLASVRNGENANVDQAMHMKTLAHAKKLTKNAAARAENERLSEYLTGSVAFYDGAFARGELLDHQMPRMDVTWASDESVTSMDAYRGKVVILDFWATWCGPCIAVFPNIKHLGEHYDGYDVAIVGVTSLQGKSYNGPTGKVVDCEGDPQKEYEQMREFMDHHGMTWDVVFTEQDCFNPDFGVRGIPHLAIVDPSGKVRHNGLHPSGVSFEEKTRMIDELLKEAGLKTSPAEQAAGG